MKRKIFFIIFLILFPIIGLKAQEHLEPNNTIFDQTSEQLEYYLKIKNILFKGIDVWSEMKYIALPSFSPEYVLNIDQNANTNKYFLQYNICDISVWSTMKWSIKNPNKEPKLTTKIKYIDDSTFKTIQSLFKKAISKTKYFNKEYVSSDGTDYIFMVKDNSEIRAGTIDSPYEGNTKNLVEIGEQLIEYVKSDDAELNKQLLDKIKKLTTEL